MKISRITPGQTIAIAAVVFLGYSLIRKSSALMNLVFHPQSIKNLRFEGATPILTMGLAVQNTSNQSFTLQSLAGEIYVNSYLVGNISTFVPQNINPNSETVLYIDARMSLLGIVNDIITAISNHTFAQTIVLEANANIDNLQAPIKLNYKFGS